MRTGKSTGDIRNHNKERATMNKPSAGLTEQDALNIFKNYMEQHESGREIFRITDSLPVNCHPYNVPSHDCWYVLCSANPSHVYMLCSSRLIVISKTTGEVVYDGSANDEG